MARGLLSPVSSDLDTCCEVNCAEAEDALLFNFNDLPEAPDGSQENYTLPFTRKLSERLYAGNAVFINGTVNKDAHKFAVNFCAQSDIAFHFNPRFDQNYIARNCKVSSQWSNEETQLSRKNPFVRGGQFFLEIYVTSAEFMVSVNGEHVCSFIHRLPLADINSMEIIGDVQISKMIITRKETYPSPCQFVKSEKSNTAIQKLESALKPGDVVEVIGRVKLLPHSFYVNLQCGDLNWPHPDVPFHLSVRFREESRSIVLNSWSSDRGGWDLEQVEPLSSFKPGQSFKLTITCCESHFSVCVDGKPLCTFKHRLDVSIIDTLFIQGDVEVKKVCFMLPKV